MSERIIHNSCPDVPGAIGAYSQAAEGAGLVFLSGQIPLDPETGELVNTDFAAEARQTFSNFLALAKAAGGGPERILKINIYLTDMGDFRELNEIAAEFLSEPFPARAAIQVAALPKGVRIEIEGVMLAADA